MITDISHNPTAVERAYLMLECRHEHIYAEKTIDGSAEATCAECGLVMKIDITLDVNK